MKVVVIGGGVVGLCSAWYLRKAGAEVTVLERGELGQHGCSWGNAGLIVPSHFVPLAAPGMVGMGLKMMLDPRGPFAFNPLADRSLLGWARKFVGFATATHVDRSGPLIRDLNLFSKRCYEELRGDFGETFAFEKTGLVMLCRRAETFVHEAHMAEEAREMGLSAEVWGPDELGSQGLGTEVKAAGGVYFADDGHLTPGVFLDQMRAKLVERGVEILGGRTATGFAVSHGRVAGVKCGDEVFEADRVVLAAGTWSKGLAELAGLDLPLVPGKGYSFTVKDPPDALRLPFLLVEARVAVTPMEGGVRFAGTMELGSWTERVSQGRLAGIRGAIPAYMPRFGREVLEGAKDVWSGLRPCLPDGLPAIGEVAPGSNLFVATGHAMMGLSLGPGTGRLVADLIFGRKPDVPVHALSPSRFKQ